VSIRGGRTANEGEDLLNGPSVEERGIAEQIGGSGVVSDDPSIGRGHQNRLAQVGEEFRPARDRAGPIRRPEGRTMISHDTLPRSAYVGVLLAPGNAASRHGPRHQQRERDDSRPSISTIVAAKEKQYAVPCSRLIGILDRRRPSLQSILHR
jgi:hypothetical protein